jgi:putative peptidoglycan lipid II flippase
LPAFQSEAALLLLIVVGVVVYGTLILLLFGRGWLRSLVRG